MDRIKNGLLLHNLLAKLLVSMKLLGRKEGFVEGLYYAKNKIPATDFPLHKADYKKDYNAKSGEFDELTFPLVKFITNFAENENLASLRSASEKSREGAGTSWQHEEGRD
ncbi:hypothetical protein Hanom_Chr09g00840151 [Helianthus anomalus]